VAVVAAAPLNKLRAFHHEVLNGGVMPFDLVQERVKR